MRASARRVARSQPVRLATARLDIIRLLPRAGAPLAVLDLGANLLLGLLPVGFVVATSVALGRVPAAVRGGLGSHAYLALVEVFLVAAAAFVGQQVVAPVRESLGELVARRVDGQVLDELMAASTGTPGIGPLEDPSVLEDLRTAARELEYGVQSPGQAVAGLLALSARYTQLVGYAAVVAVAFSWLAAVGLVVAVLLFRYGQRGGLRKYAAARFGSGAAELKNDYLRALAIQAGAAKEIRIFGLMGWLRTYLTDCYLDWLRPLWAARRAIYLWPFVYFAACGFGVSAAVFAVLGGQAAAPRAALALTAFVMVVQAALSALRLAEYYPESDLQTAVGMHAYDAVRRFTRRVADGEVPGPEPAGTAAAAMPVPLPTHGIHFDQVTFRYPGEQRTVLDRLDLTIPAGRCTALVGVNGAGKTTLVKLLARLYEPTSGAVRLDGVDIRSYPLDAWRSRLGVIFQDFARYEVSAADNVAFGAVHAAEDRAGIRAAIDAVGLGETLDALPRGIDTPLARHLEGGADLSGGQWQRVALARALFALRHGSPILVMDEPTASLDVRAEASFFDEFTELTRGATTLLISHRFSTVRRADLIVVVADGTVVEQGSHEELMTRGGRYARMFRIQADRFADADEPAVTVGVPE